MNKTELIAAMAEKAEISKKDAEKAFGVFESLANFVRTRNNINPRFVSIRKLCPLCFET